MLPDRRAALVLRAATDRPWTAEPVNSPIAATIHRSSSND